MIFKSFIYHFNARYYDATTGRFINVDPIQDGTNWYIYCNNNPLNMIDPTGLGAYENVILPINSVRVGLGKGYSNLANDVDSPFVDEAIEGIKIVEGIELKGDDTKILDKFASVEKFIWSYTPAALFKGAAILLKNLFGEDESSKPVESEVNTAKDAGTQPDTGDGLNKNIATSNSENNSSDINKAPIPSTDEGSDMTPKDTGDKES